MALHKGEEGTGDLQLSSLNFLISRSSGGHKLKIKTRKGQKSYNKAKLPANDSNSAWHKGKKVIKYIL